jgi:hypothetical protein
MNPVAFSPELSGSRTTGSCGGINLNRRQPTAMQIGGSARVTLGENDYAA